METFKTKVVEVICPHKTELGKICLLCFDEHVKELQNKIEKLQIMNKFQQQDNLKLKTKLSEIVKKVPLKNYGIEFNTKELL